MHCSGVMHSLNWSSGIYSYDVLKDDIERIVNMKASLYSIPGYDREDVSQEIRIFCIHALSKYDPSKNHSTPFNYLARCVDNRLRNLLRDNGATLPKSKRDDVRAIARCESKLKLQTALPIGDEIKEDALGSFNTSNSIDFVDSIISRLESSEIRASFYILINNGPPSIPKIHLKLIKKVIRDVYPDLL